MRDSVKWTAPSPLWEKAISRTTTLERKSELARPSILRFATDSFMDDFMRMIGDDPRRLSQFVVLPETWRGVSPPPDKVDPVPAFARNIKRLGLIAAKKKTPTDGIAAVDKFTSFRNSKGSQPLKLYQPAHQRFYLISACLICERPGLPDKRLRTEREEKVSYVIRRLFPQDGIDVNKPLPPIDSTWKEYAYILTDQGPKWKKAASKTVLTAGEETQPLFGVGFSEDDGRPRKLFAGVIPTGRREAYMAAGLAVAETESQPAKNKPIDPRVYLMRAQFRDPWKSLLQSAGHAKAALAESGSNDLKDINARKNIIKGSREQIQNISWLILLDFANFLAAELPRIWKSVYGTAVSPALNTAENELVSAINNVTLEQSFINDLILETGYTAAQVKGSLAVALKAVRSLDQTQPGQIENNLESVVISYDRKTPAGKYPQFLFPFADLSNSLRTVLDGSASFITPTDFVSNNFAGENKVNQIARLIEAVFEGMPKVESYQPPPLATQTPLDMREGWFVIRCVYERPLCGAIDPPVLSEPTKPFQIAGFFDPDAPARPIRIALPIDTTPAGLRKFNKNTAFMMSDLLCGQVNRMKGITLGDLIRSVLPFPLHKDLSVPDGGGCKDGGLSIGMMCSLSIPIITICALLLLMIIVSLLDFIFRWLPFFIICFPLPGLKSKE